MSVLNIITENINEKFINAQVLGTGKLAPRPGYYFIRNITFRPIAPFGEVPIAIVNWKATLEENFYEEVLFEMALTSLYSAKENETRGLEVEDLFGKVIYIYNPTFENRFYHGVEKVRLICSWMFIDKEPTFINIQHEILASYFGAAKTGAEARNNYINNAGYDVVEAEEWEATKGGPCIGEEWDDVYFEDYDGFEDEPVK